MSTMTGTSPSSTYKRLLNLTSGELSTTLQAIQDGNGNATPFEMNTTKLLVTTDNEITFRDEDLKIYSSQDGHLNFTSDTKIVVTAPDIDLVASNDVDVSNDLTVEGTTDSSSSSTGSLRIKGGVGVAKNMYIGGNLDIDGDTDIDDLNIAGDIVADGTGFDINVTNVTIDGTGILEIGTDASSNDVTIGNSTKTVTIGNDLNITGVNKVLDTTDSSSSTTGALIVSGGVGIAKKVYMNDTLAVNGESIFTGNISANGVLNVNNLINLTKTTDITPNTDDPATFENGYVIQKYIINGTNALTISNGKTDGQLMIINTSKSSSGTGTITGGNLAGTNIVFNDKFQSATLLWDKLEGLWCVIAIVGAKYTV